MKWDGWSVPPTTSSPSWNCSSYRTASHRADVHRMRHPAYTGAYRTAATARQLRRAGRRVTGRAVARLGVCAHHRHMQLHRTARHVGTALLDCGRHADRLALRRPLWRRSPAFTAGRPALALPSVGRALAFGVGSGTGGVTARRCCAGPALDCVELNVGVHRQCPEGIRTPVLPYLLMFNPEKTNFAYAVRPLLSIACPLALHQAAISAGLMFICVGDTPLARSSPNSWL